MMMKRLAVSITILYALISAGPSFAAERGGAVTMTIDLPRGPEAKTARLWLPYPVSDGLQEISGMAVSGNYSSSAVFQEPKSGALFLFAEWNGPSDKRTLTMQFHARTQERSAHGMKDQGLPVPVELERYRQGEPFVPVDGKVREIADDIVRGKNGILEKSRAVYDWVVENTYRNPNVRGCGLGIVEQTLAARGGKCADISSVYVSLARAAGVPAREVFGLRLGKKPEEDMTGGHHCWAEFYLPGTGWIPVDPSDVRKIMLVEKLELKDAGKPREYYFGAVDPYRIILGRGGRGITFSPPQQEGPLNYFMYPYAEVDGKALDYFDPKNFRYSIMFKEG